jgi:hypothetical protein
MYQRCRLEHPSGATRHQASAITARGGRLRPCRRAGRTRKRAGRRRQVVHVVVVTRLGLVTVVDGVASEPSAQPLDLSRAIAGRCPNQRTGLNANSKIVKFTETYWPVVATAATSSVFVPIVSRRSWSRPYRQHDPGSLRRAAWPHRHQHCAAGSPDHSVSQQCSRRAHFACRTVCCGARPQRVCTASGLAPAALNGSMRRNILSLSETDTASLPGVLPLIVGDTFYLTQRVHMSLAAVNGSACKLRHIVYAGNHPAAPVVEILNPTRDSQIPSFPQNCIPVLRQSATFAVPLRKLVHNGPNATTDATLSSSADSSPSFMDPPSRHTKLRAKPCPRQLSTFASLGLLAPVGGLCRLGSTRTPLFHVCGHWRTCPSSPNAT